MTKLRRTLLSLVLAGAGAGCAGKVDLEQVPIGTRVEVTRQDGGVVQGTLTARDDRNVRMAVGPTTRSIPRDQITGVELVDGIAPPTVHAAARFREFTVPEGTVLSVRLDSAVGSDVSQVGDPVQGTLTQSVVVDGLDVLPSGSIVKGVVTSADPSAKVRGRANLAVRFRSVSIEDRKETYALSAGFDHTAASTKSSDAKKIGIPAVGGAIIGAVIGGKKGAAIGGTIGGGAGAAVVLTTPGREVRYSRGSILSLSLDEPIDIRIPIGR